MRVVIRRRYGLAARRPRPAPTEAGIETCALVGDGDALTRPSSVIDPTSALVDIRMPPTYTHEGSQAAARLKQQWPDLGVLLLSQSIETHYAAELAPRDNPVGFGYC